MSKKSSSNLNNGNTSIFKENSFLTINSPATRWFDWLSNSQLEKWSTLLSLIFGIYIKWTVGLNPYSGYNTPPIYGDFEAQRHWMELTLNVPIKQWYYYDTEWWGLDYPPLTAYVSWICGKIGYLINPEWVELDESRGYESTELKIFMRSSLTVIITFSVMFFPFLDSLDQITQVIWRIFPLYRGLYEDKVANIWCSINVIIKLRELFEIYVLTKLSLLTTLIAILPTCFYIGITTDKHQLVHEKSILLPALPITLLIMDEPFWSPLFINVATFSLFPLLRKDQLVFPYLILLSMWNWLGSFFHQGTKSLLLRILSWLSYLFMIVFHILEFKVLPPEKYPDIYVVINVIFSSGIFILTFIYFNYKQMIDLFRKHHHQGSNEKDKVE
ncbi:14886_t:CDS:2 [Entrophospora sp. SA101]|nr:13004_t:CDS:2 [Entrophospora sp. SA101]CAJ0634226.1 14886_t:CDS:2 [Entrophospora sp. SA101]